MARCELCGNEYERAFEIVQAGKSHIFDSCLECAIHALAPTCTYCGCQIVDAGVEAVGLTYCCASCARGMGIQKVVDRA